MLVGVDSAECCTAGQLGVVFMTAELCNSCCVSSVQVRMSRGDRKACSRCFCATDWISRDGCIVTVSLHPTCVIMQLSAFLAGERGWFLPRCALCECVTDTCFFQHDRVFLFLWVSCIPVDAGVGWAVAVNQWCPHDGPACGLAVVEMPVCTCSLQLCPSRTSSRALRQRCAL